MSSCPDPGLNRSWNLRLRNEDSDVSQPTVGQTPELGQKQQHNCQVGLDEPLGHGRQISNTMHEQQQDRISGLMLKRHRPLTMDSMDSILQSQLSRFYAAAIQWTTSWYVQTLYLDRRAKMNHSLAPCPAKRTWRAGTTTHGYSMV